MVMSSDLPPRTVYELARSCGERHRELSILDQGDQNTRRSLAKYGG